MLALLAAGCSSGDDAVAEPSAPATTSAAPTTKAPEPIPSTAAPTASAAPSGQQADDEVFLAVFTATFGAQDAFSGDELVAMAKAACTNYAAGKPRIVQLADIALSDMTDSQVDVAANAIGAGIANYCPEISDDFFGEG